MTKAPHPRTRVKETTVEQPAIIGVRVLADTEEQAISEAERHVSAANESDPDSAIYYETIGADGDEYWIAVELDNIAYR